MAFDFLTKTIRFERETTDNEVYVYQEAPIMGVGGPRATIVQAQVGGALMAAAVRLNAPFFLVNNQSWKKRVCGKGNIPKDQVAVRMAEVWPTLIEHAGKDQDLIDAGAVNMFGWHAIDLKARLRGRSK